MKNILRVLLVGCLAGITLFAADVTGKWTAEMPGRGGNPMTVTMSLKADGDKLTGTVSGRGGDTAISDGKVEGDMVSFAVVREYNGNSMKQIYKGKMEGDMVSFAVVREYNGNSMKQIYKGKMEGDTIHFTMTMEGGMGNAPERKFDAKRAGD